MSPVASFRVPRQRMVDRGMVPSLVHEAGHHPAISAIPALATSPSVLPDVVLNAGRVVESVLGIWLQLDTIELRRVRDSERKEWGLAKTAVGQN